MSSTYSPHGGAPTQSCQRCGGPLPSNEVRCGNCGYYNAPAQASSSIEQAQPSLNAPWSSAAPQRADEGGLLSSQRWRQPSTPPPPSSQSNVYVQPSTPQQSFGMPPQQRSMNSPYSVPNQLAGANNFYSPSGQSTTTSNDASANANTFYSAPGQPASANTFYRAPSQPASFNNFSDAPGQPANFNTFSRTAGPQQSLYSSSSPMVAGGFQPGVLDDSQIMGDRIQPKKRSPNMGIIIGSVVLLLILIGGGIAGYTFATRHPSKSSVSTTPPPAVPTTAPKGPPMFADSFTRNTNGWNLESQPGKFSVALGNGTMALEDDDNKLLWEVVPGGRTFSNFKLSVDAVLSKGTQDNGYGVYIRGALDQNGNLVTYYRFELYGDGTYAVFKGQADAHGNSTSTRIVDYTTSSVIQKQGKLNHLVITANGSSMMIAVNGQTLKVFSDNNYTSGSLALFVSNLQHAPPGAQATFSNFAIYPPQ